MDAPRIPKKIWVVLGLLLALNLASLVVSLRNPGGHSYPQATPLVQTPAPQVDYPKVLSFVHEQISTLPIPKNGVDGKDGAPGIQGATGAQGLPGLSIKGDQGTTGATGSPGANGANGTNGQDGAQGDPGTEGKSVELRHNDASSRTEWRYVGDLAWRILMNDCVITGTCI